MNSAVGPFFVFERNGNDAGVYSSLAEIENDLEAIDVRNNEYVAYDAEGQLLHLRVRKEEGFWKLGREAVEIAFAKTNPKHTQEFRKRLEAFLGTANMPHAGPSISLSELVNAAVKLRLGRSH